MSVKIITDSGSDMGRVQDENLEVLPLTIRFGQEEYKDNVTLSHRGFYEKLIETDELPQTSQAAPFEWSEAIERALKDHDEVVLVTLSSKLSGTYQSACLAASEYDNVYVVDSMNATIGQRCLATLGLQLAKKGLSGKEIAEQLDKEKENIHLIALVDTLEYLKRGGRVSGAVAVAGSLLNIKPVVGVQDGKVEVIGKARGSKKGNNLLMQEVDKAGGIDFDRPFFIGYTGLDTSLIDKYIIDSKPLWIDHMAAPEVDTVGGAIGTHVGPGAIAVAFFAKGE
jgi:DegV family protein with EDD domain